MSTETQTNRQNHAEGATQKDRSERESQEDIRGQMMETMSYRDTEIKP
jgi:hypothetical protein